MTDQEKQDLYVSWVLSLPHRCRGENPLESREFSSVAIRHARWCGVFHDEPCDCDPDLSFEK